MTQLAKQKADELEDFNAGAFRRLTLFVPF